MNKSRFLHALALVALAMVAGCNTPSQTTSTSAKNDKDEYVTLEPEVGSHVRKRVKKSELAKQKNTGPSVKVEATDENQVLVPPITAGEAEAMATGKRP